MLVYHPALDPHHAAFRTLLLVHSFSGNMEKDQFRILDFYLVFPSLLRLVRLPPKYVRQRNTVSGRRNPYAASGEPTGLFRNIAPMQEQGLRLLLGRGLLDRDLYVKGALSSVQHAAPERVLQLIRRRQQEKRELLEFLTGILGSLPFYGNNGLKDRTGLMEHRYDAV